MNNPYREAFLSKEAERMDAIRKLNLMKPDRYDAEGNLAKSAQYFKVERLKYESMELREKCFRWEDEE